MTVSTDKNQYLADLSCVSSFYQVLMCGKNWFHVLPSESVQDNHSAGMLTRIRTICPGSLDVPEPRFGSDHKWRKSPSILISKNIRNREFASSIASSSVAIRISIDEMPWMPSIDKLDTLLTCKYLQNFSSQSRAREKISHCF